jgi:4'-phosphopantetheinyl transferase EntD
MRSRSRWRTCGRASKTQLPERGRPFERPIHSRRGSLSHHRSRRQRRPRFGRFLDGCRAAPGTAWYARGMGTRSTASTSKAPRPRGGWHPLNVLRQVVPSTVVAEERFADVSAARLFLEEEAVVSRAVESRRREFATGRACARVALARLGRPAAPLLPDERGAPLWPAEVVGSITHCAGYCCAAVADVGRVGAIGIDAEPNEPLVDGIVEIAARPEERQRLKRLSATDPATCWDRLLFSCKEAAYKAWYPATRQWLDFSDMSVVFDPADRSFAVQLLRRGMKLGGHPVELLPGRWVVARGLVLTVVACSREGDPC